MVFGGRARQSGRSLQRAKTKSILQGACCTSPEQGKSVKGVKGQWNWDQAEGRASRDSS